MSILDTLMDKLAPHDCLVCGAEDDLLCTVCSNTLLAAPERCYRCQAVSLGFLTCPACRQTSWLASVRIAAIYEAAAKNLIWKLKLAGTQSAAGIMARRMAVLMANLPPPAIIVPVPTASSRVRRRGYDQARLLARELSRQTRLPYRSCLVRIGQTHQHGLARRQRLSQLAAAFRVSRAGIPGKAHVILVDDVSTTGATLEAAALVLRAAGADRIDAVVFARPLLP
jgi:ComF family protein